MTEQVRVVEGIVELTADVSDSPYWSYDIAPTTSAARKWGGWDVTALWMGISICIPTYMLASGLMAGGMNWWQSILTISLGNLLITIPMILNAHPGTKYGIPFPVLARASFGLQGAHVPTLLRTIVACGWFGIQTWIGGWAIYKLLEGFFPSWTHQPLLPVIGINAAQLVCFLAFWSLNIWIVWKGFESIRSIENWGAPILIAMGVAVLIWAMIKAGGPGPIFDQPQRLSGDAFSRFFIPALTSMVSFWSALTINISDFTRFVRTQKAQVWGQFVGINTAMPLYSFIGVAVTSAALLLFQNDPTIFSGYGRWIDSGRTALSFQNHLWDPVFLLSQIRHPVLILLAVLGMTLATLTTNIGANVVATATSFSNLAPRMISFKWGCLLTGLIGILMMPWKLLADPQGYIYTWLIGYSALLGPIAGILIADYHLLRKRELDLYQLYIPQSAYKKINWIGISALLVGIIPNIPGFLGTVGLVAVSASWVRLYHYAWFVGFATSMMFYWVASIIVRKRP
ncbi:MAG TPA: NCS1 family nucleobase:cation symporter-1 [Elusimicrobiota bacterium]|nr:NCS1 family nucleobase:cation symporter-1 [Elusimicrobiota bacterium]